MSGINRDEWLKALEEAGYSQEHDPDATTVQEFAEMLGLKRSAAQHRLDQLVRLGKARRTARHGVSMSGKRRLTYVAYRLT